MPSLASARLIVPISPAEKKAVEQKASSQHISTAEFVRRAVLQYDPRNQDQQEEAELRALLDVFADTRASTLAQLEKTDRALDAAFAYFAGKSQ